MGHHVERELGFELDRPHRSSKPLRSTPSAPGRDSATSGLAPSAGTSATSARRRGPRRSRRGSRRRSPSPAGRTRSSRGLRRAAARPASSRAAARQRVFLDALDLDDVHAASSSASPSAATVAYRIEIRHRLLDPLAPQGGVEPHVVLAGHAPDPGQCRTAPRGGRARPRAGTSSRARLAHQAQAELGVLVVALDVVQRQAAHLLVEVSVDHHAGRRHRRDRARDVRRPEAAVHALEAVRVLPDLRAGRPWKYRPACCRESSS